MYYKVIRNRKVIDVLDTLEYVKYQVKHGVLLLCDEEEAQGVLSSDKSTAFHTRTLNAFPVDGLFDTVTIEEISQPEYNRLKILNLKTPEEIAESVVLEMIERRIM